MPAFDGSELWDNGYWNAETGYNVHSPQARAVFQTAATSVDIDVYVNYVPGGGPAFQVWVNGLPYASPALAPTEGAQTVTQALPPGPKRVAIVGGLQSVTTGIVRGVFLVGCEFNDTATPLPPEAPGRVLAYGDSTSQGGNIDTAWPTVFRAISARSLVVEAANGRQLRDDIPNATARAAFVAKLAGARPAAIWIAIGVNDYQNGTWDSATFGTNYGLFLDELHAVLPNARIYCATPLMKYSERLNSPARHLESYRQAIRALIYPRAEWATLVEGQAILSLDDMESDGLHPNVVGHRKYAEYVEAALNGKTVFDRPLIGETADVDWTNIVNASEVGSSLTKSGGTSGDDDAGGTSSRKILAAPWAVRFTVSETNKLRIFGVSSDPDSVALGSVLYGWSPQIAGTMRPWQEGGNYGYGDAASFTNLSAGGHLQIRCDGTHVYYETIRAGECVTIRKASRPIESGDYPLYAKAVLMGGGSTVTDAKMQGLLG